jgi:hypothetical protein
MTPNQDQYSTARLADRAQIQDLLCRWSRAIDRLDYDAIRDVFHPDAIDRHGAFEGPVDGLIEWIRDRHANIPFSMHMLGNMLIEFADDDTAIVETYTITIQRYPREGRASLEALIGSVPPSDAPATDLFVAARYVDKVTRRGGTWRIETRDVVFDSSTIVDSALLEPFGFPGLERGVRASTDTIFRARSAAGLR